MPIIKPDALSQTLMFVIVQDSGGSNPGEPATGLDNTDITSAYYARDREAATAISVSALSTPTSSYSSGGFKEIDATNLPGLYRFDIPNAAVAFGTTVGRVIVQLNMNGASNAIASPIEIDLDVPKAVWDDLRSRHISPFSLGESIDALTPIRGNAEPAGASPTSFITNLTETINDFWNGAILVFTGGTLDGQARQVVNYNGSTKVVTVNPGFTSAPIASDSFILIASTGVRDQVIAELAAVPAPNAGSETMLKFLYMALRNKIETDSNTALTKVHNDAGSSIGSSTFSDTGGIFTRGKYS